MGSLRQFCSPAKSFLTDHFVFNNTVNTLLKLQRNAMKLPNIKSAAIAAALLAAASSSAHASIVISEVAPWSSGNSPIEADWFELTNTGASAVNISGWKMDDNSNNFGSSVSLTGVNSIAAGQSVIFIESASSSINALFTSTWFGTKPPAGLTLGNYSGSGVGLSTGGDAVNIFNASGVLQAKVTFGASDSVKPFQSFDNAAGLNNAAITLLSVAGVNGAFVAANDANEIGSPGTISAVPVPAAVWMFGSALLGLTGLARKRKTA
jgi:hypothetical protein